MIKFKPENSGDLLPTDALEQDYAQSESAGNIYLGKQCVYLRRFSGTAYLPYRQILRAWLRQEEVRARMCCATANFDQFYLVMACADGRERRWQVPDKAAGQSCLEHITSQNPEVKIGFVKSEK